jgi:hypothetical protein
MPDFTEVRTIVEEIDETEKLDAQDKGLHKKVQSAIDDLIGTLSKECFFAREVELAASFFKRQFRDQKLLTPTGITSTYIPRAQKGTAHAG